MEHLLHDLDDGLRDFLLVLRIERGPDFGCGRGHGSHSFTSDNNSSTALHVSVVRGRSGRPVARFVARSGSRNCAPILYRTKTVAEDSGPRETLRSSNRLP